MRHTIHMSSSISRGSSTSHLEERLDSRTIVNEGALLTMCLDRVENQHGQQLTREVVLHHGAAAVVPLLTPDRTILVRQWRHPLGEALWEIPAGKLEPGEEPLECARRELAEETGYTASRMEALLPGCAAAPGYSSELLYLFVADGLQEGIAHTDPDEHLDVKAFTGAELAKIAAAGLMDMKTVAALSLTGRLRIAGLYWSSPSS